MSDLISRSALMNELARNSIVKIVVVGEKTVWDIVKDQPTIEAVEVVHGKWEEITDNWYDEIIYRCSVCNEEFVTIDGTPAENLYNFCPNCGADMRGKEQS